MFTCGTCTFFWQPYPSQYRSAHDVPPNRSSGQWVDSLTDCGPNGRKTRFCLLVPLAAGSWGSFNMQALACPRPPLTPPWWRQLPAAPCVAWGRGAAPRATVPWAGPSRAGVGWGVGSHWVPPAPGCRARGAGSSKASTWPLSPSILVAHPAQSPTSEASWPFCEVLQAEPADFLVRMYWKDRGLRAADQEPDPSGPQPFHPSAPILSGLVSGGQAQRLWPSPPSASCQDVTLSGKEHAVLGSPGLPFVPGKRRGLLSWQPAPPPSNSPLR